MRNQIKISFIEYDIAWESPEKNFTFLNTQLQGLKTDLVILPEMFSTGFSMNVDKIGEKPFGISYKWMKQKSYELNAAICASIPTKENKKYYNRFYFVNKEETKVYDKKHLFGYGKEPKFYTAKNEIVEFDYLGWKIRPIICYDLRFPVWCRNNSDYDLMICVANWPKPRIDAWQSLLKARSIENMAYTIGVNRIGNDPFGLEYVGKSKVFDALGKEIIPEKKENLYSFELNKIQQQKQREKFGFLNDRESFKIIN